MVWIISILLTLPLIYSFLSRKYPGLALVSLPFSMIGYILLGGVFTDYYDDESYLIISIIGSAVTFFLTVLLTAMYPYDSSFEKAPWPRTWARLIIGAVRDLCILIALLFLMNYFGLILFALLIGAGLRSKKAISYSRALEILSVLYHAASKNLPFATALNIAAQNQYSRAAPMMNSIAHWLVQGYPLGLAMEKAWPKAPSHIISVIQAAEKINQLPQVLENLLDNITERTNEYRQIKPVSPAYPITVLTFASLILLGLMIFIIPTFAEVLSDMSEGKMHLPATTQMLLNFSNSMMDCQGLNFLMMLAVGLTVGMFLMILRRLYRIRNSLTHRLVDWMKWHLPVVGRFEQDTAFLYTAEYLQAAIQAGLPIHLALQDLQHLTMNSFFLRKVARWASSIEKGQPMATAAKKAGMGRTLEWAFDEKLNSRNLPAIMTMLKELTSNKYEYRLNLIRSISCPLMVLALGAVVGLIMHGMFAPMVQVLYACMVDFTP